MPSSKRARSVSHQSCDASDSDLDHCSGETLELDTCLPRSSRARVGVEIGMACNGQSQQEEADTQEILDEEIAATEADLLLFAPTGGASSIPAPAPASVAMAMAIFPVMEEEIVVGPPSMKLLMHPPSLDRNHWQDAPVCSWREAWFVNLLVFTP